MPRSTLGRLTSSQTPPERLDGVHGRVEHLAHARLAGVAQELLDHAEAQPFEVAAVGHARPARVSPMLVESRGSRAGDEVQQRGRVLARRG